MPVYEYRHTEGQGPECDEGFLIEQKMRDDKLAVCPICGKPVERLLFTPLISTPQGDSHLKSVGFTKLVKRDDGVYENVTRTGNEKRYMTRGDVASLPDIKRKISD